MTHPVASTTLGGARADALRAPGVPPRARPGRGFPLPEDVVQQVEIQARYDGYLTIEREVGENPVADIAEAVRYLRSFK